jgi:ATP-dependent Clp endopeptidase proteolytic subunit ClpP
MFTSSLQLGTSDRLDSFKSWLLELLESCGRATWDMRTIYPNRLLQIIPAAKRSGAAIAMYSFDSDRWAQQSRTLFLRHSIDDTAANQAIAQLIYFDLEDSDTPIQMYINTESGVVAAGLAIYDTMQSLRSQVHTICMGVADGIGSLLLASGSPSNRSAQPHARIRLAWIIHEGLQKEENKKPETE